MTGDLFVLKDGYEGCYLRASPDDESASFFVDRKEVFMDLGDEICSPFNNMMLPVICRGRVGWVMGGILEHIR